ncbi:MAG: class I SAM-dependent methyltransferase [Sulfitobacter sp.]
MNNSLIHKTGRKALAHARMAKRRLGPRAAPKGMSMHREGAMSELDAVTLSTRFPGWLNVPASIITLHLLTLVPFGPVVEIGVFRGKYLSILRAAMGASCRIVGYDIFHQAQAPLVEQEFAKAFGDLGNVKLIQADSTRLTAKRLVSDCGEKPVFMSVDGSHEAGPVLSDMKLADAVLHEAGIVAMDDVLNPVALGVNEAVGRFLCESNPALVPFAYVANKLFFCRPDHHKKYLQHTTEHMEWRGDDPSFAFYHENTEKGEDLRRKYFGYDVLIVTG